MPELGKYEKMPRPESIDYFIRIVSSKEFVQKVEPLRRQVYRIVRKDKHDIVVFLTNVYIVGEADVYEITSENKDINSIVTVSAWNSCSRDAKQLAKTMNIGLFDMKEFLGAIYYAGTSFTNYTPPEKDGGINFATRMRHK
jgi:predicted RNase H-like nuclease (RuvC/YqgF family)